MADYPTSVTSFVAKTDFTDSVLAAHVNKLQDELYAVQVELGTSPSGASATVAARAAALESSKFAAGSTILAALGSVGSPGLSFSGASTMGLYQSAAGVLGVATAGAARMTVSSTEVLLTPPLTVQAGSVSAPGLRFTGATTTGLWLATAGTVGVSSAGTEVARFGPASATLATVVEGVTPTASAHLTRKDYVDSADTAHANLTSPHSAVSAPTADRLVVRDASARARFADPSHVQDAATKGYVDTADTAHANLTSPHSATEFATADRLVVRDANARARFADPVNRQDAATKGYVDDSLDAKFTQSRTEFTATLASTGGDMTKWNGTGSVKRGVWAASNQVATVWMKFVYGSTGAVGNGNLYANLPVNADNGLDAITQATAPGGATTIGTWHMRTAAGVTDLGTAQLRTNGTVFFLRPASGQLLDTADMTATDDTLYMQLTYPIV